MSITDDSNTAVGLLCGYFNRACRDEILNMYVFRTLSEVREITENWMRQFNKVRLHGSLGDLTPWEYRV